MSAQCVYFVRALGGDYPIKIGCSVDPARRMANLNEWVPYQLKLIATTPGGYALESALHNMFTDDWLAGEWFKPSARLLALIDRVKDGLPFEVAANPNARDGARRTVTRQKKQWSRMIYAVENEALGRAGSPRGYLARIAGRPEPARSIIDGYRHANGVPPNAAQSFALFKYMASLRAMQQTN